MEKENLTRERIILTARKRFLLTGYKRVTMDEIAEELGMSKKTLYQFFPGKYELLDAVMTNEMTHSSCEIDAIIHNPSYTVPEKVQLIMRFASDQFAKLNPVVLYDIQKFAPEVWEKFENWRNEHIKKEFINLLNQGIDSGIFRKDICVLVTLAVYASSFNLINAEFLMQSNLSPAEVYDSICKIIYEGIYTEEGRKACGRKND
jgi:AcrR family transcriptional regulator